MNRLGCFTLLLAVLLASISPFLFPIALEGGLAKLAVPGDLWIVYLLAMVAGCAINLSLWRRSTEKFVRLDPLAVVGLEGLLPHWTELRRESRIAVNVGGCLLPLAMAAYEVVRLATSRGENVHRALIVLALTTGVNIAVCWWLARVVPAVGVLIPGFIPPLIAAAFAILLQADAAPPVALVSGTLGPIFGSVLRLPELKRQPVALASIGGAGTFDTVVMSTVIASLLG